MALVDLISRLSRALTDVELRASCSSNEIDFGTAIGQMPDLLELAYLFKQFEAMASSYPPGDDIVLEAGYNFLIAQNKALIALLPGLIRRTTAISNIMAQCGFSNSVPCGRLLDELPPSHMPELDNISIQAVSRGRSIPEWADSKRRSYQNDPTFPYWTQGKLEQRMWDDLPPELQKWVLRPTADSGPLGFLRSCYYTLKSPAFQTALCKSLQTTRHTARADMGNRHCQTCHPNLHRVIHKPRGSLWEKPKMLLKQIISSRQSAQGLSS